MLSPSIDGGGTLQFLFHLTGVAIYCDKVSSFLDMLRVRSGTSDEKQEQIAGGAPSPPHKRSQRQSWMHLLIGGTFLLSLGIQARTAKMYSQSIVAARPDSRAAQVSRQPPNRILDVVPRKKGRFQQALPAKQHDHNNRPTNSSLLPPTISIDSLVNATYETASPHYATRPLANNKNHLVFHVGPPRTGTTTLQTELTQLESFLLKDKYFYAGRYYHPFVGPRGNLVLNRTESDLLGIARTMLQRKTCKLKPMKLCLGKFKKELEKYRGQNVILSDDIWGNMLGFRSWEEYQAIQDAVGDDWEVTIVVGYWPFFQWIRSTLSQYNRMDRPDRWKNSWPGQGGGRKVRTLFPELYQHRNWYKAGFPFVDSVVHNTKDRVHLRLMHLDQGDESLRTKFVCNMLPSAPKTCAESRRLDVNVGDSKMHVNENVRHFHYDILATRAAELQLIDTEQHSRPDIRNALHNFTENLLGKSHMQLNLSCPTRDQLYDLLQLTLDLEEECLGKEWAAKLETKTREDYRAEVADQVFCTVDADATLSKEPWKKFLEQFSKNKETNHIRVRPYDVSTQARA